MDSNVPANPAYGVFISQLVRYARICTSKVDFINSYADFHYVSDNKALKPIDFRTHLINSSINRLGLIVEKYGAALREMRLAIQA